jgi:hypothetical protein
VALKSFTTFYTRVLVSFHFFPNCYFFFIFFLLFILFADLQKELGKCICFRAETSFYLFFNTQKPKIFICLADTYEDKCFIFFPPSEKLFTFLVSLEAKKKLLCRPVEEQSVAATVSSTKGSVFDSSLLLMKEKILVFSFTLLNVAFDDAIMN